MVNRKMPELKNLKRKPGKHSYTKKVRTRTQKVGVQSFRRSQETRMSSSSDIKNQNPSCEMENLRSLQGEQSRRSGDLEQIIRQMISKPVKELIAECRAKRKAIDSNDVSKSTLSEHLQRQEDADSSHTMRQRRGRSTKNPVVGEKVVLFSLPDDCDAEQIKDIDKVKERLGEWMIQRRQRDSKLTDTYYRHIGSLSSFRSIKEVANFIISGSVPEVNLKRKQAKSVKAELSSKRVKHKNAKLEAIPEEVAGNIVDSINNTKDVINYSPTEIVANSNPEKIHCDLQQNSLEFEPCDDQKEIGKENSAEVQALTSTESVEASTLTPEANDEESQVVKEHSDVEGTTLQENCGQEFETLVEATEKVEKAQLDGVDVHDFKDDIYDQLQDLKMDWKSYNYSISDACFDEYGMLNHVPIQITEANDGESQILKEKSKEIVTSLQGGEQEFETLDEAAISVEDDFANNIYNQLEELDMGRKSNYGISDAYFDEYDLYSQQCPNLL